MPTSLRWCATSMRGPPSAVVAEAGVLADAEGLENVTLATLAARLGVRPPSLYKHVDSLDALHRALTEEALTAVHAALLESVAGRAGDDALRALCWAWRNWARRRPGQFAATVRAWPHHAALEALGARIVALVTATLRDRRLDAGETVHAVRTVRSAVHGFCALELGGGFGLPVDLDASFEVLIATLVRGLPRHAAR